MGSKTCKTCGYAKPMAEYADADCVGGKRHSCRACENAKSRRRRAERRRRDRESPAKDLGHVVSILGASVPVWTVELNRLVAGRVAG